MLSLGLIQAIIQDYFQYFFMDNMHTPLRLFSLLNINSPQTATSYFIIAIFIGGLFVLIVGHLSDFQRGKYRYIFLVLGFLLQLPLPAVMLTVQNFDLIIPLSIIQGIGSSTIRKTSQSQLQLLLNEFDANIIGFGNGLYIVLSYSIPIAFTLIDGYTIDHYHAIDNIIICNQNKTEFLMDENSDVQ